jgi:hypothetical protein
VRRFVLVRKVDVSGVSGAGLVAEGVEFTDGRVSTRWLPPAAGPAQTCVWDHVADVLAVHGHGGLTELRWIDPPPGVPPTPATTVIPVSPPTSVLEQPDAGTPLFDELLNPPPPAA